MQAAVAFLRQYQRYVVTSHARPDGDSIGSSLALALALEQTGKEVRVVQADSPPHAYQWLPGIDRLESTSHFPGETEAVAVLECNDLERTGVKGLQPYPLLNVDHHPGCNEYGDVNWIDPAAAAVAEMVYKLILALGVELTPEIATNLYVGISTDTGSYQFANTTAESFEVTSKLVTAGAKPGEIGERVYLSHPLSKVLLLREVLNTLFVHPSGRIATLFLTREMMDRVQAKESETEGIVTHALSIDGVMAVAFIREVGPKKWRISLRSKGRYDVGELARRYAGGGHVNAAGARMEGTRKRVFEVLIPELERILG